MKKTIFIFFTLIMFSNFLRGQDIFVNRVYQTITGSPLFNPVLNPFGVQWSKTIKGATGGLIMVGYTSTSAQGQNIYLVKQSASGSILFQQSYNSSGSNNDYGLGLVEASNGDIYICGTTDNGGGASGYDLVVLHVNSSGVQQGSMIIKDGPAGGDDFGASISQHSSGNIIVAGNTVDGSGLSDMWVLKYSTSLSYIADNTYDYAGLTDIAIGLSFSSGGNINLIGPSASSAMACDYVQVNFNPTSLAYLSETRSNIPGTALDQATDFCKDANDNTYITGKTWNGTNFDIKTIKINANSSIAWTATLNPNGFDDAGTSITTDGNGDIIVGGYTGKSTNVKNLICLKYSSSTGSLMWAQPFIRSSQNPSGDASIKQVCTNPSNNDIYFASVQQGTNGWKQSLVTKLTSAGLMRWNKVISSNTNDILPSDIQCSSDTVYVISVLDSITGHYITTKFTQLELDTTRSYKSGQPAFKSHELILAFVPSKMNATTINDQGLEFGPLSSFLTTTANSSVLNAFHTICPTCHFNAVKIYDGMKTSDVMAVSRLGQNVSIPPIWSTLLVQLPPNVSIQQAQVAFNSVQNVVSYAHPNYFMRPDSPPNDSLYSTQYALQSISPYPNAGINVEEAWNVVQSCGASFVKAGVFDFGADYRHRDLGYNGNVNSGK